MDDIQLSNFDNETLDIGNMSDMGDIEIRSETRSSNKKSILKPKKKSFFQPKTFHPPPKQHQQQQQQPLKPKPNPFIDFKDKSFELFSNPHKRVVREEIPEVDDSDSEAGSQPQQHQDDDESNDGGYGFDDDGGNDGGGEEANVLRPASGFATIDDEKQDYIYKFHRLEQKGIKCKKFTMYSDIREMRAEYSKIKKDAEMTSGLKFSKRMLMAIVSGMEFMNKRYDPLNVELNGWSESVMESMTDGDYDNVLERLQEKYSGKVNTPPEMELLLGLAGSAVMFHMTSTMFKSVGPSINDFVKQNPDMMHEIFRKATQQQQQQGPNEENENENEVNEESSGRHSMRGPSMDLSSGLGGLSGLGNLGSMFGGPPPPMSTSGDRNPIFNMIPPIEVDETPEPSISGNNDVREVSLASTTASKKRRGRPKKLDENKGIDIDV